jgi:hypothetical protein
MTLRRLAVLSLLVALVVSALTVFAPASGGAGTPVVRHPVYGGMNAVLGDCPVVPGPAGTSCTETWLQIARGYWVFGGGSVAPPDAHWHVCAEKTRFDFDGSDDPPAYHTWGCADLGKDALISVDLTKLNAASASGVHLVLEDGTILDFEGTWEATSDRSVYGRDGPVTIDGAPHHCVDRCVTVNSISHQKFTVARMNGTLNGEPVRSYNNDPSDWYGSGYMFNNNFKLIVAPHNGSACP